MPIAICADSLVINITDTAIAQFFVGKLLRPDQFYEFVSVRGFYVSTDDINVAHFHQLAVSKSADYVPARFKERVCFGTQ